MQTVRKSWLLLISFPLVATRGTVRHEIISIAISLQRLSDDGQYRERKELTTLEWSRLICGHGLLNDVPTNTHFAIALVLAFYPSRESPKSFALTWCVRALACHPAPLHHEDNQ